MMLNAAMMFAMPTLIFACGTALLSYRFYAAYHAWAPKEFGYKSHLPGILGTSLMLFAIRIILGWTHAIVTLLGGFAVSYLYGTSFGCGLGRAVGPVFAGCRSC
jgi:hypothetical protein